MQLIRTITQKKENKASRKIREIILSLSINMRYTKLQIINCYLANAYYGAYMNGINQAMNHLFEKRRIEDLSLFESAVIAALLQQPLPKKPSIGRELSIIKRVLNTQRRSIAVKNSFQKSDVRCFK